MEQNDDEDEHEEEHRDKHIEHEHIPFLSIPIDTSQSIVFIDYTSKTTGCCCLRFCRQAL